MMITIHISCLAAWLVLRGLINNEGRVGRAVIRVESVRLGNVVDMRNSFRAQFAGVSR